MFWNWIGRSQEEIAQARQDWMEGSRFGEVKGYDGDPLRAPELPPVPLKPRGRVRDLVRAIKLAGRRRGR